MTNTSSKLQAPTGIHTIWSKPQMAASGEFWMSDFDVFLLMSSALTWKKHHNQEAMIFLDESSLEFLKSIGVLWPWRSYDTSMLREFDRKYKIQAIHYPTAGKTFIITTLDIPFLFIDHDLILFQKVPNHFFRHPIVFAHKERNSMPIYPGPKLLQTPPGYRFNDKLDWNKDLLIPNTSLTYLNHKTFQKEYRREALRFMCGNSAAKKSELKMAQYLYPDQQLPCQLAKLHAIDYLTFHDFLSPHTPTQFELPLNSFPEEKVTQFVHVWFRKRAIRSSTKIRNMFTNQLLVSVKLHTHPEDFKRLVNTPYLKQLIAAGEAYKA